MLSKRQFFDDLEAAGGKENLVPQLHIHSLLPLDAYAFPGCIGGATACKGVRLRY